MFTNLNQLAARLRNMAVPMHDGSIAEIRLTMTREEALALADLLDGVAIASERMQGVEMQGGPL